MTVKYYITVVDDEGRFLGFISGAKYIDLREYAGTLGYKPYGRIIKGHKK